MPSTNAHEDEISPPNCDEDQTATPDPVPTPTDAKSDSPKSDDGWAGLIAKKKIGKKSKRGNKKGNSTAPEPPPASDIPLYPPPDDEDPSCGVSVSVPRKHGVALRPNDVPQETEVLPELETLHEPELSYDDPLPLVDYGQEAIVQDPRLEPEATHETKPESVVEQSNMVEQKDLLPQSSPRESPLLRSPRALSATLASPASPPRKFNRYNNPGAYNSPMRYNPAPSQRRESFAQSTLIPPWSNTINPPPPHMAQEHFFRPSNLEFLPGQKQDQGKVAGSDGCCCCFDSFADSGDAVSAKKAKDALLVGSEGGLDVYRVLSDKLEVVGRLEGLRGLVIGAKILPSMGRADHFAARRPLVALIVHGLMGDDRADSGQDDDADQEPPNQYQTTIEVYSLQRQQHIATLYKSLPAKMELPVVGHLSLPPGPIGDLTLDAAGSFVTVASGKSGEIFVFSSAWDLDVKKPHFRLVGKFWTAVQMKQDAVLPENTAATTDVEKRAGVPLMSLGHRWLAIVPPYTSASHTISGSPLLIADRPIPPGLNSLSAPPQPSINCEVAGVDEEAMLSWLSRTAAQGLVKASQKGYEMSLQGWRELTNPSQSNNHVRVASTDLFPPTNASADDPKRLAQEPALISLIDLSELLHHQGNRPKQLPVPFATFALIEGCNHLSFSPDGLRLLTTNRRGEASTIWDITNAAHGSTKRWFTKDTALERGPHVKQIHRILRSSPSVVVESLWSQDGDWLALVTVHGTAHLHKLPQTKGARRRKTAATAPALDKAEATVGVSQGMSPPSNGLWGRFSSGLQSVGTQVNAIRTQGSIQTTFAGFREATGTLKSAGSRAIAKGLSQGLSAAKNGASEFWHVDDNKIRLGALQGTGMSAACARWVHRNSETSLAVVCGGAVYVWGVSCVVRRKGELDVPVLKYEKRSKKTFTLYRISTTREDGGSGCADAGPHGFWTLRAPASPEETHAGMAPRPTRPMPAAQVTDVETNPPYCPFHIDGRVNIFAYEETASVAALETFVFRGHGLDGEEDGWLFGEPLPPSLRMNDVSLGELDGTSDMKFRDVDADDDDDIESLADQVESRLTVHNVGAEGSGSQEIHVATRRSRRGNGGGFEMLDDAEENTEM